MQRNKGFFFPFIAFGPLTDHRHDSLACVVYEYFPAQKYRYKIHIVLRSEGYTLRTTQYSSDRETPTKKDALYYVRNLHPFILEFENLT